MDHIHVLVDGAFQASDQLVLPKDLRVKLDELPNGEALREQAEKRIEIMVRSAQAQTRVTAATDSTRSSRTRTRSVPKSSKPLRTK